MKKWGSNKNRTLSAKDLKEQRKARIKKLGLRLRGMGKSYRWIHDAFSKKRELKMEYKALYKLLKGE
jgi:hypothetical protein